MNETERPQTPNETLAATVAEDLIAAGIVPASRRKDLLEKLVRGTAKQQDWLGWIEAGLDAQSSEGEK